MKLLRDVFFASLTCAFVLLLLEAGLRVAHVWHDASFYQSEQERGYSLRPNAAGWNVSENENYVRINSDGMRDHERPISRPPATLRIAILGSSEAEGRQVPIEKTLTAVLNRGLDRPLRPLRHSADVMNFAVPGYTFSQHYLTLHNHVWKYDPQIVILVVSVPTIFKNTRELDWGGNIGTPFYVLQNGQLVPDQLTRSAPPVTAGRLYWKNRTSDWMNRSALLSLLNQAAFEILKQEKALFAKLNQPTTPSAGNGLPAHDVTRWSYLPDLPNTQGAWKIGEAFLELMRRDCSAHGAEFWIVTVDLTEQSHPSLAERARFASTMRVPSLGGSDQRIKRFADAQGIPVILLAPPLSDYAAAHGVALHGFPQTPFNNGHWNELGHELAGNVISQQLLDRSKTVSLWASPAPITRSTTASLPPNCGLPQLQ
jgi:hypothetical protein